MKITSITEAFSMQPATIYVGMIFSYSGTTKTATVDRIVEENILITGDPFEYYVWYDSDGNRLFEFRKGTVNVMYEP